MAAAMLPARDLPGAPATAATAGTTLYTAGAAAALYTAAHAAALHRAEAAEELVRSLHRSARATRLALAASMADNAALRKAHAAATNSEYGATTNLGGSAAVAPQESQLHARTHTHTHGQPGPAPRQRDARRAGQGRRGPARVGALA